jgi:hypothetical protein
MPGGISSGEHGKETELRDPMGLGGVAWKKTLKKARSSMPIEKAGGDEAGHDWCWGHFGFR